MQKEFCRDESGVSPFVIALVCSVIQCCLEEFQNGTRTLIPYTTLQYSGKYRAICRLMARISERNPAGMQKLCVKTMKRGLRSAGAGAHREVETSMTDADIDAAAAELDELSEEEEYSD
ncbi:hypothetical protein SCHPADRAFT_957236 [Schizopora paradoxa]|uniref:DUF6532 domain-containing protein n=1 Tax=Schizopora paradoxa TaxID=27342 RepID=A0A0H2S0M1_9AGAM|nr:hypothetical protein SCHPADRAFT_957236 [Schizopora paradoxa]